MNDARSVGPRRNGSRPETPAESEAQRTVVVFGGAPEPAVHDPLPVPRLPQLTPGNTVALTFDDGPDRWTQPILDILGAHDVKATFFVVGEKVVDHHQLVRRIVEAGHEVGNHTFTHQNLANLADEEACLELADCSGVIHSATGGCAPYFYRPPFLHDSAAAGAAGLALGMFSVGADVIGEDWRLTDWREITNRVTRGVKQGGRIVLLHDGVPTDRGGDRAATVKTVKAAVPWLLDHGYRLVTVSQLFGRVANE